MCGSKCRCAWPFVRRRRMSDGRVERIDQQGSGMRIEKYQGVSDRGSQGSAVTATMA